MLPCQGARESGGGGGGCCVAPAEESAATSAAAVTGKQQRQRRRSGSSHGSESDALQILEQFERLYESRVAEVEADPRASETQRTELKLKIMTDWVKDLGEQNAMLVQTVHDLEQAAVSRVKLLENKLQATSNLISHNMSHTDKSEEDLNVLSNRICHLVSEQNDMEKRISCLQSDIGNLLELIKRGRIENNWDIDGITFYEIQPSDIPIPLDCTCNQITSVTDNEESACDKRDLQIKKLSEQLHNTETKMEKLIFEQKSRESELQKKIVTKCKEFEDLKMLFACLEKESIESQEALTAEVAQKHDSILHLKDKIKCLEDKLQESRVSLHYKDQVILQLRDELRKDSDKDSKIKFLESQLAELKLKLQYKDDINNKLKNNIKAVEEKVPTTRRVRISTESSETVEDPSQDISLENQNAILIYLINLKASMEKESETLRNLKIEHESVLKSSKHIMNMYEKDVVLANEKLQDIQTFLNSYRSEVLEQDNCTDSVREFITSVEKKVIFIEKLFQNNCKKCVKENIQSEVQDVISKVTMGIQKLSDVCENKYKIISSIGNMIAESNTNHNKNMMTEQEQKAIFAAILQQYRMMEEFRICTVEVQAATEDLREEMSEVIANLNSRHCKYVELNEMVSQIQEYLSKTRENMSEVINHLELQDEERTRHSERITNNRIRLKDIKNEFNQTHSELSKCLNNVQNNIQQTNLLGYTEIHMCNDLFISVAEEVEQIVNNLYTFQSQGCCTLTTMTELKNQLTTMEHNVEELKRKSEQILLENETAQKSFVERLKRLEKYECEVDNCHSKMQDALESIVTIRDQMNEFGCIKETDNSFKSTNETIKMKEELRRLQKECEELNFKISQESQLDTKKDNISEWECKIVNLQDQNKVLQNELKFKQQTNNFLKQSIELLEKELNITRTKAEDYRRCSSSECLELKKKIFELENSLKVQKDMENNFKYLENNETDSKKSQLLDYVKDRHYESSIKHSLQGTHENICQLFKGLQDTIQTIKSGLQELTDELKKLVPESSSNTNSSTHSVQAATETLAKYVESIKHCFYEVEKIKAALYSKDKLMENMDKIIRIQKDSITISQSEVEDVHKTLQEKIDAQEKMIAQMEKEKRHLTKQIDLQVQTIGHLQEAVVEAKRTIDQLTNKAACDSYNKSQIIRSLNLYLSEAQSQYSDCYGEASEQGALLESQRDAICTLQKKIIYLECDEFVQMFILHFVYYIILYKYQEELELQNRKFTDMKSKIRELEYSKTQSEKKYEQLQCRYREANEEIENLRCNFEEFRKRLCSEKQREIDELLLDNDDLKKQLEVYKLDFDIIEEEMKRMGIVDQSVESFRVELDTMCMENEQFRSDVNKYKKIIEELKCSNECLSKKLQDVQNSKDVSIQTYKEKIFALQNEIIHKNRKIEYLNAQITPNETMISELLQINDDLKRKLSHSEVRLKSYFNDLGSSKETISALQSHIDSLKISLQEKFDHLEKLERENQSLKDAYNLLKSRQALYSEQYKHNITSLQRELKDTESNLTKAQKNYEKTLQCLNKTKSHSAKFLTERRLSDDYPHQNLVTCNCACSTVQREDKSEEIKKLTKELEDCQEKLSSKNAALHDLHSKHNAIVNKFEACERSCQRQKDEIMLLEKKLACVNQKFQNCKEKNEELIRQNKSFEDSNNKCMEELEDIVLQLEDMQSSLVELRTECDNKSQSLECVSAELAKMKVSRSEVCEESKHVLNWLRRWMREQKQAAGELREKLRDRQQRLLRISSEKKNFMNEMKRLKRINRVLTKRLKLIHKPAVAKHAAAIVGGCSLSLCTAQKSIVKQGNNFQNGFHSWSHRRESNAVYSYFRKECKKGSNRTVDRITGQGDCRLFRTLEHLSKVVPRTSQITENNIGTEENFHKDTADSGYQTSSSK